MQSKNVSNAIGLLSLSLAALATCAGRAETPADGTGLFGAYAASKEWTPPNDPAVLKKLQEWQSQKLGLLISWQVCAQWQIDSWPLVTTRHPWNNRPAPYAQLSDSEFKKAYDNLITTFNPTKFNPGKWATAAKDAGVKYVLAMSKHHDGFCMWDTATTDYKITSKQCPFHTDRRSDTIKEMSAAFRKWDAAGNTLSGTSKVIKDDPYELRIAGLADGGKQWKLASAVVSPEDQAAGVTITPKPTVAGEEGWLRVVISSRASREVKWTIHF